MPTTASEPAAPPPVGSANPLRRFLARFSHLLHELGRFGVVGAVSYGVDTATYALCAQTLQIETLTAKTIATTISATVAFAGNRYWTWRDRGRSRLHREYALYFFFNLVGLAIGLACVALSHYGLGSIWPSMFHSFLADLIAANVVGLALGTIFRFWAYRRFVFRPVVQSA